MRILVTGGCGFLGSHVCELFKREDWDVIAYDNLTKFEYGRAGFKEEIRDYNLKYLEHIGVATIVDDIRNFKTLSKAAKSVDFIAHCAAQPAMTIAIEDRGLDFDINVHGTLNVLDVALAENIPFVNCSSIHVYGNDLNKELTAQKTRFTHFRSSIREDEPLLQGAVSPLHASKMTTELYTRAYTDTYGLKAANFRLTGIYGPRQFGGEDHGWVANFIIRTLLDRPIKIFGTDKQVRDILYVTDAAQAFLDWYNNGCISGTYNIGGGPASATSIQELLLYIEEITDKRAEVELLPARHGDLWWFVSDAGKANSVFDWDIQVRPSGGIRHLIDWVEGEKELFE